MKFFACLLCAFVIGAILGNVMGYERGWADAWLSREKKPGDKGTDDESDGDDE